MRGWIMKAVMILKEVHRLLMRRVDLMKLLRIPTPNATNSSTPKQSEKLAISKAVLATHRLRSTRTIKVKVRIITNQLQKMVVMVRNNRRRRERRIAAKISGNT